MNPIAAVFTCYPKYIHKPDNPRRPIVSTCHCPTAIISEYLHHILSPPVEKLPTFIKDTMHAIRTFKHFQFNGPNRYIFTLDITSLYTSIPIADGLVALQFFLDKDNSSGCSTRTLLRSAELVLNTAGFEFDEKFY